MCYSNRIRYAVGLGSISSMNSWSFSLIALAAAVLPSCGAVGFMRYGLTQGNPGSLHPGDSAPDIALVNTDGETVHLHDFVGERPLVMIFGSFT